MKNTISAFWCRNGCCQAVMLRKSGQGWEWLEAVEESSFDRLKESSIFRKYIQSGRADENLVGGIDSSLTICYQVELPLLVDEELDSLVRIQAERLLPVPLDDVELTWEVIRNDDRKQTVLLTAIRKDHIIAYKQLLPPLQPGKVFFSGQALVEAAKLLLPIEESEYVIVRMEESTTLVCVVQCDRLNHVVSLDYGGDQTENKSGSGAIIPDQFIYDLRHIIQRKQMSGDLPMPVIIVSEPDKRLVNPLVEAGFSVRCVRVDRGKMLSADALSIDDINGWLIPIGLALIGLKESSGGINLITSGQKTKVSAEKSGIYSLAAAMTAFGILLITCLFVWYQYDRHVLAMLETYVAGEKAPVDVSTLLSRQALRKKIAAQRPDLLELLSGIKNCLVEDIMLDEFIFRKYQRVRITGTCKEPKTLIGFQRKLQENSMFQSVRVEKESRDKEGKIVQFTISMDYRNFTRKIRE